jgi:hypothetical protein
MITSDEEGAEQKIHSVFGCISVYIIDHQCLS